MRAKGIAGALLTVAAMGLGGGYAISDAASGQPYAVVQALSVRPVSPAPGGARSTHTVQACGVDRGKSLTESATVKLKARR